MVTGDPRHTSHDEQWLQHEVDAAFAQNDPELQPLARRAAVPLLARISPTVASTATLPELIVEMPLVLRVPSPVPYAAEVFASVDQSEFVRIGTFTMRGGGKIDALLPASARTPGLHRLRLRSHLSYRDGPLLSPEVRELPEVLYALFDPVFRAPYSGATLIEIATLAKAQDRAVGCRTRHSGRG